MKMDYKEMRLKIIKYAYIVGLLLTIIGFFVENKIQFISGIFLGTTVSSLMFYQLTNTLNKASFMFPEEAQRYATSRYVARMAIYAIAIIASMKSNQINAFGVIIGIFTIKISVLFLTLTKRVE